MSERNIENNIDKNQHTVVPPMHDKCSGVFYNTNIFLFSFILFFSSRIRIHTIHNVCGFFFTPHIYFIYLFVAAVDFGFVI